MTAESTTTNLNLAHLNAVQIAALRTNLQARRLEVQRALRRGTMVEVSALEDLMVRGCLNFRNLVLSLHVRVAPQVEAARTPAAAKAIVMEEIEHAVAELANKYVTKAELMATRDQAASVPRGKRSNRKRKST